MFAGALHLEAMAVAASRSREYYDQVDFEETLDRRRAIRKGLKLAHRYRRFYKRNCNLTILYERAREAAHEFRAGTILYAGFDRYKTQILFRWLRNEAQWHGLEAIWTSHVVGVRWSF